jgi:NADH-quinone oxidoreductase subunit G
MDVTLGTGDVAAIRRELGSMPASRGDRPAPRRPAAGRRRRGRGVLATWHQ